MIPQLSNQTTSRLNFITMVGKVKDTESFNLQPLNPLVIPNANQFSGYQQGQRKYFKVIVTVDFCEIDEAVYNSMPNEPIIT